MKTIESDDFGVNFASMRMDGTPKGSKEGWKIVNDDLEDWFDTFEFGEQVQLIMGQNLGEGMKWLQNLERKELVIL